MMPLSASGQKQMAWHGLSPLTIKIIRFWLQTTAAIGICLWVGYELALTLVSSAAITVCIVADPNSGSVFSKSKWRLIGSLAGGLVIALLALWFAQAPWIFLTGLAIWTAICSYISACFRYFQAYAAALSGYTATIILVEIHNVFDLVAFSTVQRVAEIILGVLSVALVFGLTHVRKGIARLEPEMHTQGRRTLDLASTILDNPTRDHMVAQLRLWVRQTEDLQHNLLLLGEEEAIFAKQARSIRIALSDLYGPLSHFSESLLALSQTPDTEQTRVARQAVLDCMTHLTTATNSAQAVQQIIDEVLPALREPIERAAAKQANAGIRRQIRAIPDSLRTLLISLQNYRQIRHEPLSAPSRKTGHLVENRIAKFQAVGVGIGYLAFCAFWIESGWTGGDVALLMFVAVSMLQMSSDQPVLNLLSMFKGLAIASLVALPLKFLMLPASEGFGWLMFLLAFGLLPGCAFKSIPKTASIGSGYLLFFPLLLGLDNQMSYDIQAFASEVVSMCVSIFAAIVLMAAVHPWRAESRLKLLLTQAQRDYEQTLVSLRHGQFDAIHQWEDRQMLRVLQMDHVVMLSDPAMADRAAGDLLRLSAAARHSLNRYQQHATLLPGNRHSERLS
ncbi:FUSC family protein [Orrella marina]|uniref:FUSC family protein n=1 Tax=Orrella marina TaxID=2163011 RepID=A0A2R4XGL8_9BURK|nr:FUSC family protein [Orrella marina]AWB32968.1 hypothetical protein DBV39_03715 [Orrella marina]